MCPSVMYFTLPLGSKRNFRFGVLPQTQSILHLLYEEFDHHQSALELAKMPSSYAFPKALDDFVSIWQLKMLPGKNLKDLDE